MPIYNEQPRSAFEAEGDKSRRPTTKIKNMPITQRFFGIPFTFNVSTLAGATYSSTYTISTNFNFLWELTQVSKMDSVTGIQDSTATPTMRDFQLQIRDEFTSEDMFTSSIYASMLAGDGKSQNILPRPYTFQGGTTITLTATDVFGGAAGFTVQIALIGYKIRRIK